MHGSCLPIDDFDGTPEVLRFAGLVFFKATTYPYDEALLTGMGSAFNADLISGCGNVPIWRIHHYVFKLRSRLVSWREWAVRYMLDLIGCVTCNEEGTVYEGCDTDLTLSEDHSYCDCPATSFSTRMGSASLVPSRIVTRATNLVRLVMSAARNIMSILSGQCSRALLSPLYHV